ncbi:MAG: class IV adenylate cyclase [Deltaproteobacteria bacterium]|nr:class IV adenylate cyclase [Deltaproteobacteria bacterium]
MGHVNIELKARWANAEGIRDILRERNADFRGVDHQIDTYFKVNHGRLKLREGNIENCLVYYERENQPGPKQSTVSLFPVSPGSALKEILTQSVGILVVVEKQREIYFIDNVKFHVDTVKGLGSFVEIEAIDMGGTLGKDTLLAQCQEFLELFHIAAGDLVASSYSDLLLSDLRNSDNPNATAHTIAATTKTS